jgi:NAD(P)H-flavin reductase
MRRAGHGPPSHVPHVTTACAAQILESLNVGDFVEVKGPIGHFHYMRPGRFTNHKHEGVVDRVNMIAGGTGLTPMYQVMKRILSDPEDKVELRMLYANNCEGDILCRKELEELAAAHPGRCVPSLVTPVSLP